MTDECLHALHVGRTQQQKLKSPPHATAAARADAPAKQLMQLGALLYENVPGGHDKQLGDPAGAYVPLSQELHDEIGSDDDEPALQAVQ